MNKHSVLITFASWEDRFTLGFQRDLERGDRSSVLMFYFDSYADRTRENRKAITEMCIERGVELQHHSLEINQPAANWHTLCAVIQERIHASEDVHLDISTMPREIIWNILWLLEIMSATVSYCYHCPEEYSDEWLSRDPGPPRLVYKLSGTPSLSARTALLITAGYDPQRVNQLINWYEPEKVVIGLQSESPFKHNVQKMAEYRAAFGDDNDFSIFELDAYSEDHGQAAVQSIVSELKLSHNLIMSSLGPKVTAIGLYCIQRVNPEIALAYAPSNQFNEDYSHGIGDCISGDIESANV